MKSRTLNFLLLLSVAVCIRIPHQQMMLALRNSNANQKTIEEKITPFQNAKDLNLNALLLDLKQNKIKNTLRDLLLNLLKNATTANKNARTENAGLIITNTNDRETNTAALTTNQEERTKLDNAKKSLDNAKKSMDAVKANLDQEKQDLSDIVSYISERSATDAATTEAATTEAATTEASALFQDDFESYASSSEMATNWPVMQRSVLHAGPECKGGGGQCIKFNDCNAAGDAFFKPTFSVAATVSFWSYGRVLMGAAKEFPGDHSWPHYPKSSEVRQGWKRVTLSSSRWNQSPWRLMWETYGGIDCVSYLDDVLVVPTS